jgi:hypothetical protein
MDLIVWIIIVLVVVALAMWLVYYIPLPPGSPVWIKNVFYVVLLLVAILAIVYRTGVIH